MWPMFTSRHVLFRNFFTCVYSFMSIMAIGTVRCLTGHKVFVVSCDSLCVVIILNININK